MPKKVSAYRAVHYSVNVKPNDPVDISCGGPRYLGFDFFVDVEEPQEDIALFIRGELKKKGSPCASISHSPAVVEKLWTLKMISDCIRNTDL
jgi:hypothetical protein